jgi:hypothetical protein
LLRGLALAVKQVDVRLTLVGARHPDWQPHLEDLVSELGLGKHVEFQPPVAHADVAKVLALADVGVLPLDDVDRNRVQGGALAKVSEYLAAGRPVLAADLPVARELIPASAGVFYPPGEAQALADRIIELARDVPRRVSLGKQARAYAEQWLDAGLIRGQLLDIYDGLLGKGPVPAEPRSERELSPTTIGTPTNRVIGLAGTVSADAPQSPAQAPEEELPEVEAIPDTDPGHGGPISEEPPLVVGHALIEEGLDNRLIKTEIDPSRPDGPPVVMGLPLRDPPAPTVAPAPAPPPLPPRPSITARAVPPESRPPLPPALPPKRELTPAASRPSLAIPPLPPRPLSGPRPVTAPSAPPVLQPVAAPAAPPVLTRSPAPRPKPPEEPEEISASDAVALQDVDASPTPTDAHPLEEPEEISSAEIHEAETPETPPQEPPESRLNPWFAQLAHGYCPPEGTQFARHTPPTTMPGRDNEPVPPPAPRVQGASRGKPS